MWFNSFFFFFFFQKSVISLPDQLRMFKEYIGKLNATVGAEQTNFILANSLFFLVAGSNDIANTYYLSHAREIMYDISSYTDLMIKFASGVLEVSFHLLNLLSMTHWLYFSYSLLFQGCNFPTRIILEKGVRVRIYVFR